MEIFNIDKLIKLPKLEISCATIGNFDGVHKAHKVLINETKKYGFKSLVITFDDLGKDDIISLEQKIKLIEDLNVDYLIILKFEDFKNMFYYEFNKMLKKLKVKRVVIGKDFRYGFKNEGDYIDLDNKFEVDIIDDFLEKDEKISSTKIRNLLKTSNISAANNLLGYNYYLEGVVVSGNALGRTIGFPTANLDCKTLLSGGVYKTITTINDKKYNSITNIGYNPTFNQQEEMKIETNIIDFNDNLYDLVIKVEFISKIREEIKFTSKEELIEQLNKDKSSWS